LKTPTESYAATCRRAWWLATCRRAARRGPPGRSAVSGVPMAPERSADRLEHLSMYRQRCSSGREELCKDSAIPRPVAGRCRIDLRPPGHQTGSALGDEPVKHARAIRAARRQLPLRRTRRATLTRSKRRSQLNSGALDPRTRPRINRIIGTHQTATSGLLGSCAAASRIATSAASRRPAASF
jgi:hypothetical protein